MTVLDLAKRWYSASLPDKMDDYFASFAAKSSAMAYQIAPGYLRIDPNAPTAYIDHRGIAYLPQKYFSKAFYEELGIQEEDITAAAVTVINGSTMHEALHRRWTSPYLVLIKTIDEYISKFKFSKKKPDHYEWLTSRHTDEQIRQSVSQWSSEVYRMKRDMTDEESEMYEGSDLAKTIAVKDRMVLFFIQIVEDLYNENRARSEFEGIAGFLNEKNSIIFDYTFQEYKQQFLDEPNVENLMNTLVAYKSISIRKDDFWTSSDFIIQIVDLLQESHDTSLDHMGRMDLAVRLAMLVSQNQEIDQQEEQQSGSCSKLIDGNSEAEAGPSAKLTKEEKEVLDTFMKAVEESEVKKMELDDDSTLLPDHKFDLDSIPKPIVVDVVKMTSRRRPEPISYNPDFIRFASVLKYHMEQKTVYGPTRDKGPEISKKYLNRIGFDPRIFTRREVIGKDIGSPEVIILDDFSGSMMAKDVRNEKGQSETLALATIRASYGAHVSMNRLGIPNAIYSHTTGGPNGGDGCVLYAIAAYDMPFLGGERSKTMTTRDVAQRFAVAATMSSNENYDGFAVREASKRFSGRDNDKILIVLSDGQPSATNYGGQEAIKHTHSVAKVLRRNGIKVFSMSLVPSVVSINDEIYGQEFNMRAFGTSLTKNIEDVIRRAIFM